MKRLVITGALGHIGSKLIHSLKPEQFKEVRLIDNLSTQRFASLFNLPQRVKFSFFEDDICQANLDKYFKDIDVVIHLAAITDAALSFQRPKEVERVNFYGTKRVAQACIKNKSKLIFPSTTSVYGVQEGSVDEDCRKCDLKPQSPYATSKLKAEQLLIRLGKKNNLKFIICRLGTIFGFSIGMRFHTAVNKFIWQASLGKPITVWRTAIHQKRPYLDLNDAIKAMFYIIEKPLFDKQIYNIVTVNSTVSEIVAIIRKSIPDIKIDYVESKIMNQLNYTVSNEKFKKTGFKFSGDLEKGIKKTIKMLSSLKDG